jgi:hypothetical protein
VVDDRGPDPVDQIAHRVGIGDVDAACREPVDTDDLVARVLQVADQMAADEPRRTRHQGLDRGRHGGHGGRS